MKAATAMREIARIAEGQDGLVTTSQAVRLGVPRLSLARLADAGDVERLAHGVYRVRGADADRLTELRAAWIAADPARTASERAADLNHPIVVSHRSAAAVHGIGNLYADRHEMSAPVRKQSRRGDVIVHRASVSRADIVIVSGMLVTSMERTLADLARTEPELGDVADALADAYRRGAVELDSLAPMLDPAAKRHGRRDGADLLQRMLELKGLDASTALTALSRQPNVGRLLGEAWAPAIRSGLEAALGDAIPNLAVRELLESSNLAVMPPAMLEAVRAAVASAISPAVRAAMESIALPTAALVDIGHVIDPMRDAIAASGVMENVARSLASPSLAAITRDIDNYNNLARLARQATAGLPTGFVSRVMGDD